MLHGDQILFESKAKISGDKGVKKVNENETVSEKLLLNTTKTTLLDDQILLQPKPTVSGETGVEKVNENETVSEKLGVAICAIQKNAEMYLEEWIDYYFIIGVDKLYVYDNSEEHVLKDWAYNPSDILEIIHFPGEVQQKPAYEHCARKIKSERLYEWVAFFDLDEFLVLKNYTRIQDMIVAVTQGLQPQSIGGLALNWLIFDYNNQLRYQPFPLSQRFTRRERDVNMHVKTIVYVQHYAGYINPHAFSYSRDDIFAYDTTSKQLKETPWFNPNGPSDIAVLHHYHTKSIEE